MPSLVHRGQLPYAKTQVNPFVLQMLGLLKNGVLSHAEMCDFSFDVLLNLGELFMALFDLYFTCFRVLWSDRVCKEHAECCYCSC